MNKKYKAYLKINLMSIFFIVVSFISVTLAWFAYSGLSKVATEVGVKAWNIEFKKGANDISNDIVISVEDIYPGMETKSEIVNINNNGDSDAELKYKIVSARILDKPADNYEASDSLSSETIEEALSHDYPFHINLNLSQNFVVSKGTSSTFNVSVSWPLDSDTDDEDSKWGNAAYDFQTDYPKELAIKIVISLTAEQYTGNDSAPDIDYGMGQLVLFDTSTNDFCTELGGTCIATHVIDKKNLVSDKKVSLLPELTGTIQNGPFSSFNEMLGNSMKGWNSYVVTKALGVQDILNIISTDVTNSFLVRPELSNSIIGYLGNDTTFNEELAKATPATKLASGNPYGSYSYSISNRFNFLSTSTCVWTKDKYGTLNTGFAYVNDTATTGKVYSETGNCNVIPVIMATKNKSS